MSLRDEIFKSFKKGVYEASDARFKRSYYRCGIPGIDAAMGGGVIRGGICEIFGPYGSGKTLIVNHFLIENQKRGGTSILFLSEGAPAFDPAWYAKLGGIIDGPNGLIVMPVKTIEDVFTKTWKILEKMEALDSPPDLIIGWDGIAATGSAKLFDTGMDKKDLTKAGALGEGMKLITTALGEVGASFIATNQVRDKIGDDKWAPTHTPGGYAYKFACSQRVELNFDGGDATSRVKDPDTKTVMGRRIRGKTVKNRGPEGSFRFTVYQDLEFPHPIYEGTDITPGIDIPECVFTYYKDTPFGPDNKPILVSAGPRWKIEAPGYEVSFYRKQWPEILKQHPELYDVNFDPYVEAEDVTDAV
jgi:RecA/RadA recombinase